MAKMPGLLRPRQKIDQAELELDQTRMAARLADIFGGSAPAAAEDESPGVAPVEADAPAEVDQSPAAEQPVHPDVAVSTKRRGSRPAIVIGPPPGTIGIVAEPDERGVDDGPGPDRTAMVGVMAHPGPTVAAGPGAEWWSAAVDYALIGDVGATDASNASDADADAGALSDAPTRGEADEAVAPLPALAADSAEALPAVPRDDPAAPGSRRSDAEPSNRVRAKRRPPEPRPRTKAQPGGKSPRSASARRAKLAKAAPVAVAVAASCPYCAALLEPPPKSSRGCPRCRHRIVVKRIDGRAVYLTEAAVLYFEAERRRIASSQRWTRERQRWLKLAAAAEAPPERAARLAAAQLSEEAVDAARALYMNTVERAFRSAKRDRRWEDASRIRREQAMALFRLAGSGSIPPEAIVTLHRAGVAAELRGIAEIAKDAELVSAACCDICRADDGRICRITQELLAPRLPHPGCPKGLCRCRWDLTARDRTTLRRYQRRPARANQRAVPAALESTV